MKQLLWVFIGGGSGSVLRYLISRMLSEATLLPLGTLVVNVVGSFLIGIFLSLGLKQEMLSPETSLLLTTGFCGGFTTFSAFAYENQLFLKNGDFLGLGIYIVSSLILSLGAVFAGIYLTRFF